MGLIDPGADGSANHLLHGIAITDAFGGSLSQRERDLRLYVVEDVVFFGKGSSSNFWPDLDSPGGRVNRAED